MEGEHRSDPRIPFIIGIVVLAVFLIGGIVFAVFFLPEDTSGGRTDANVAFNDANDPVFGPDDAKVVVRMFEDFQCPACRSAKGGVNHAKRTYGDRVKFIWNDFPLTSIHRNARPAANAARCAEEQGTFWEYHDVLYDFQSNWAEERNPGDQFLSLAKRVGLDEGAFQSCLFANKYDDKVRADMDEARANRVDSTPTFFIGNRRIAGGISPADWDRELKAALAEAGVQ
jgi:protein-disulfide isomerase